MDTWVCLDARLGTFLRLEGFWVVILYSFPSCMLLNRLSIGSPWLTVTPVEGMTIRRAARRGVRPTLRGRGAKGQGSSHSTQELTRENMEETISSRGEGKGVKIEPGPSRRAR